MKMPVREVMKALLALGEELKEKEPEVSTVVLAINRLLWMRQEKRLLGKIKEPYLQQSIATLLYN